LPRNKNPEETIQKIFDASLELFKEKGFDKTTILDIVERVGMTRGAFYHHFKSKEDVLYALMERSYDVSMKQLDASLSGLEQLRQLIVFDTQEQVADEAFLTHIMLDLMKDSRVMAECVRENQGEGLQWLFPILEAGMADSSIRRQDKDVLGELIMLLLNFWLLPTVYPCNEAIFSLKIQTARTILEQMGCPLIDEAVAEKMNLLRERLG